MNAKMTKIFSQVDNRIFLRVYQGHFATSHSHVTHYFDMTTIKSRLSEARAVAEVLAQRYTMETVVDTIVCMEGMEIVGAFLAEELKQGGIQSMNTHQTIYVISPEINLSGQLIFRDNYKMMLEGKNVLLLLATATTGRTLQSCIDSVLYYGGKINGIASVFTAISRVANIHVNSIFTTKDIPNYASYSVSECPMCKAGDKIDALVNSYGYSSM